MAVVGGFGPKLLARGMGMKSGDTTRLVAEIQKMNSPEAAEARMQGQWKALSSGRSEDLSLQQMAAIQDIASRMAAGEGLSGAPSRMAAPGSGPAAGAAGKMELAQSLMKAFKEQESFGSSFRRQTLRDSERLRRFYKKRRAVIVPALYLVAGFFALAGAFGLISAIRGVSRFVLTMGFTQSGYFLMLASVLTVVYYLVSKLNPWPLLPWEVVLAPVSYMVICGACLRVLDPNVPVWNMMLKSMASPVVSSLAVVGLGFAMPKISAAIGSAQGAPAAASGS